MNPFLFVSFLAGELLAPVAKIRAYLDPGSGSFILQLLLATLLGGLFVVKAYWQKIRTFVSKLFSKRDEPKE